MRESKSLKADVLKVKEALLVFGINVLLLNSTALN